MSFQEREYAQRKKIRVIYKLGNIPLWGALLIVVYFKVQGYLLLHPTHDAFESGAVWFFALIFAVLVPAMAGDMARKGQFSVVIAMLAMFLIFGKLYALVVVAIWVWSDVLIESIFDLKHWVQDLPRVLRS